MKFVSIRVRPRLAIACLALAAAGAARSCGIERAQELGLVRLYGSAAQEYRKFKHPFRTVWRVGSGRASASLGADRVFAGGISA